MRTLVLLAGLGLAVASALRGQCADGSPPPCTRPPARTGTPSANSIAVLYFDNLSRDSADAYLADGLTDEIIVRLQQVPRLDVKSRHEVRRLRGARVGDARTVGRDLRVAWLVTGSVRPSASRMRVSYELVRATDGRTMASGIIDTTAADQWAISNSVSVRIARSVAGELAPAENAALARGPRDAQAVDLHRRGRFLVSRGIRQNRFDVMMSLAFFQAAIERDSSFVEAWTDLARAWAFLDTYFPNRVAGENGRRAGNRAMALDSASGAAAAVVYALATVDYDWPAAERVAQRALVLNPRDALTRATLALVLSATGRADEAVAEIHRAWDADSLDPSLGWYVYNVLATARQFEELARWSPRLAGWETYSGYWAQLGLGRADSALALSRSTGQRVLALAAGGRLAEARDSAAHYQRRVDSLRAGGGYVGTGDMQAMAWAAAGDLDRAFAALELSYRMRSGSEFPWFKVWPWFAPLRADPRGQEMLRRMRLE